MKNNITMPVVSLNRHRLKTDGVGVTTLVASFGCPLTCKYCINKRTWDPAMLPKCVQMTPEQLYDKLKIDDLYFIATGGGITFGGGESLLHADFIAAFRELCGDKWQITVETSLNVPTEKLHTILPVANAFIVDIKDMNPEIYKAYTGLDNNRVIENLKIIFKEKSQVCIRIRVPAIRDFNTKEDMEASVQILKEMGFTDIEVFPYIIRNE
ncbi:MAG: radical SAM protein [Lachnospiraceae bacterium]|nr:radical SAM protein [Lachnospiraceae bacterium]